MKCIFNVNLVNCVVKLLLTSYVVYNVVLTFSDREVDFLMYSYIKITVVYLALKVGDYLTKPPKRKNIQDYNWITPVIYPVIEITASIALVGVIVVHKRGLEGVREAVLAVTIPNLVLYIVDCIRLNFYKVKTKPYRVGNVIKTLTLAGVILYFIVTS